MGAERVDLDATQAYFEQWQKLSLDGSVIGEIAAKALAVTTELRDAREVVKAATRFWDAFGDECGGLICDQLAHALNAYDRHDPPPSQQQAEPAHAVWGYDWQPEPPDDQAEKGD
jgi:hypothetical protein